MAPGAEARPERTEPRAPPQGPSPVPAPSAAIVAEQNALCEPDQYSPRGKLLNPAPGIEYDVDDMQE